MGRAEGQECYPLTECNDIQPGVRGALNTSEIEIIEDMISIMTPTIEEIEFTNNRILKRKAREIMREFKRERTWNLIEISDSEQSLQDGQRV